MKTVLVTGANKGIGFETARQLLRQGHHVVISARDKNRLEQAAVALKEEGGKVDTLLMDVSVSSSITEAAVRFHAQQARLDVLINNAAILFKSDARLVADEERILEETMRTNGFGAFRVIRAFLPFLSQPGRIINVSSGGGSMSDPVGGWSPAYCVSKSFLNAMTRHLADELKEQGISVNAVCPGWVKTDMGGRSAPLSVEQGADTLVWMTTVDQLPTGKFFRDRKVIPW